MGKNREHKTNNNTTICKSAGAKPTPYAGLLLTRLVIRVSVNHDPSRPF